VTAALTLVVLTEDGGASGWAPVVTLVRALCNRLITGVRWQSVNVLPQADASADVLRAVAANRWKGTDGYGHNLRVQLTRYLASQLLAAPGAPRFVFFHVDADRRWADGGPEASENVAKFHKLIVHGVRMQLLAALTQRDRAGEIDALMARLHLVAPCWSIESWLYQGANRAASLCQARSCAGAHVEQYEEWAASRTKLDDLEHPKDRRDLHCLNDADKTTLADAFPAHDVHAAGRSFAYAVDAAANDGALLNALIATRLAS
jgi:hypothetical protein